MATVCARVRVSVASVSEKPVVSLRARTEADRDVQYRLAADLETWEERNPDPPRPLTRAQFDARQARGASDDDPDAAVAFMIDVDGVAVGAASLFGFDSFARHAEMGINLLPEARGLGIGTAAIKQLVDFGFVRRNLRRIHLQAIASNAAAIRAYEKAGFTIEGRRREHAYVRGRYEDIVLMSILRAG
jgi:RimJ/RimL family protein N-acetyltransferase